MENPEIKTHELAKQSLRQQLEGAGIDVSLWGKGQAKTLEHLQKEIESGETILAVGEQGELLRKVVIGGADIYYVAPDGRKYRLREERQVFKDGRERKRRELGHAVSEKMKPNENPREAMIRGIKEELGIEGEISLTEISIEEEFVSSPSYPGLQAHFIWHKFRAMLSESQFRKEGYVEKQQDKSTYFIWEEIE